MRRQLFLKDIGLLLLLSLLLPLNAFSDEVIETLTGSLTGPAGWTNNTSFRLNWSASDTMSDGSIPPGIHYVVISIFENHSWRSVYQSPNYSSGTKSASGYTDQTVATSGSYTYDLAVINYNDVTFSTMEDVNVDLERPIITVTYPTDYAVVSTSSINVQGSATDALSGVDSLTINGQSVSGNLNLFSQSVTLNSGLNTIAIQAKDQAGNEATSTVHVTYNSPVFINPTINPTSIYNLGEQITFSYQTNFDGIVRIDIEDSTTGKENGTIQDAVSVSKDATQPYTAIFSGAVQTNNQWLFLDLGNYTFKAELKDTNGASYNPPVYFKSQVGVNVTRQSVTSQIQTPSNPSGSRINIPNANLAFTMHGGTLDGVIMAQGASGSTLQVPQIGSYVGSYQVTVSKPGYLSATTAFDPSSSTIFLCNTFRPNMPNESGYTDNIADPNYIDSDGDSIPDGWEYKYWNQWQSWTPDCGCDLSIPDGNNQDKDQLYSRPERRTTLGDGLTNLQEYQLQQKGISDLDPRYIDLIVQVDWIKSSYKNYLPSDLAKQTCSSVLMKAGVKVHWAPQGHEINNLPDIVLNSPSVSLLQLNDILNANFGNYIFDNPNNAMHIIHAIFAPGWTVIEGVSTNATTGAGGLYLQSPPGVFVFDLHTRNLETEPYPTPVANSSNSNLLDQYEGYILAHEIGHALGLPDIGEMH